MGKPSVIDYKFSITSEPIDFNHLFLKVLDTRKIWIEKMAAAYFTITNIDPRDVELVESHEGDKIVFYFRRRGSPIIEVKA